MYTVKELYDYLGNYLNNCGSDDSKEERGKRNVMIIDDRMKPSFYDIDSILGTEYSRMAVPPQIEYREEIIHKKIPDISELEKRGEFKKLSCYHECDKCDINGHCIEKDGVKQLVPVQIKPAEYKNEKILGLVICSLDEVALKSAKNTIAY